MEKITKYIRQVSDINLRQGKQERRKRRWSTQTEWGLQLHGTAGAGLTKEVTSERRIGFRYFFPSF